MLKEEEKKIKVQRIIDYVKMNGITAYSIAKATKVSEAGIGKILNKSVKKPRDLTLDAICNFLFSNEQGENLEDGKATEVQKNNGYAKMNGLEFKKYRKNLGISQEILGKALFVSRRTIITYEKSKKVPQNKVQLMLSIYETNEQKEKKIKVQQNIDFGKMNGIQLKEIRKDLGLTQAQFAKALDFHLNTVQKWENGDIKMRKNNILAVENLHNKHVNPFKGIGVNEDKENIEVLYAEHIAFKNALNVIKEQGFKAYTIHKKTGLNEAGIRRILNEEVKNPQRKTKEILMNFAKLISKEAESDTLNNTNEYKNLNFSDLKIDDKLNMIFKMLKVLIQKP